MSKIDLRKLPGKEAQKLLKEEVCYNKHTGFFTKRKDGGGKKKGDVVGSLTSHGYIAVYVKNVRYYAHRLIFLYMDGEFPKDYVDHVNHERWNNKFSNLRNVSIRDQNRNCSIPVNNKSQCSGVSWSKVSQKWRAYITINRKQIHLGLFKEKLKAIKARKEAETKHEFHDNHCKKQKPLVERAGFKPKGYGWHKASSKWRAYIQINKKYIHLGHFNTKEEAITARLEAEEKYKNEK